VVAHGWQGQSNLRESTQPPLAGFFVHDAQLSTSRLVYECTTTLFHELSALLLELKALEAVLRVEPVNQRQQLHWFACPVAGKERSSIRDVT